MVHSRQPLLLLLCFCLAVALTPHASTAPESYTLEWMIPDIPDWSVDTIFYIPGRLVNTTDCDPNIVSCPGVNGIDVTVNAEGGDVTLGPYPERSAAAGNTSAGVSPHPPKTPQDKRKLAPGNHPDSRLRQPVGHAKPGKAELKACSGFPLVVQTKNFNADGYFYFGATSSVVGQTFFTASAEVNGQTVSTGPLTFTYLEPPTYTLAWTTENLDAPVPGGGFFVYGQIYDSNTCLDGPAGASCSGPENVAVTVTAIGAEVTLSYDSPEGAAGKHPVSPGNASGSHAPSALKAKNIPGQPQQTGLKPVTRPLPSGVQRPDKVAPKQSCVSPPHCASTLTVYTGFGGYFVLYVSPGASNLGGSTDLVASAELEGQSLSTTAPLTVTWLPRLDLSSISLAPAGRQRVALGSKAKLTATVTSPDGAPVADVTVNFKVTLAPDEEQLQSVAAASTNSQATPAAALPITKQATSNEDGQAVLKLANPKHDRPGTYKVVAFANNNQDDVVKSNPVLVTWQDRHEHYGDYGYGEDNTKSGGYGYGDEHKNSGDHGYGKGDERRYKDAHTN